MAFYPWETVRESVTVYTGLSPASLFTVLALALAVYYMVSSLFVSANHQRIKRNYVEEMEPLPPPVQLGEITEEELKQYDGSDIKKPLLMAIKGQIYDVSISRMFYGPGGPYALFAGKDASRALAKMSFEENDLTGDISGLDLSELETLTGWESKFTDKYVKVGTIKKDSDPVADDDDASAPQAAGGDAAKPAEAAQSAPQGPAADSKAE